MSDDLFHSGDTSAETDGPRLVAKNEGLVAEALSKRIKGREIIRQISLTANRGEVVGLLGPNGAGKTTTFYMLTGLIRADAGRITLDGIDMTRLPMYRRARLGLGYLPQEPSIFRGLSVEDNLLALLETNDMSRDECRAFADELLEEFNIAHLRSASSVTLSGGERRRLEIARVLTSQPHIVLLDEPLTGIDPIAINEIRDLILHLKDRGIGVIVTDHNVRETLNMVDRAYVVYEGVVLREGRPSDVVHDENVRRVFLGDRFKL